MVKCLCETCKNYYVSGRHLDEIPGCIAAGGIDSFYCDGCTADNKCTGCTKYEHIDVV